MRFIDFTFLETTLPRPEKNMKPRDFGLEHHFANVFHEFRCTRFNKSWAMGVALSHPLNNQITINHPAIGVSPLMDID
jgi:hypothetical protein